VFSDCDDCDWLLAPLTIGMIRISNKSCQLRISAKPDCASHPTTVSTSNARRGDSKIISAMSRFSGVNGACQSGRNNKTGRGFGASREKPYPYVGSLMKDETARAGFLQTVKDEFSHEISEFRSFRRRGTIPLDDMEEMNMFTTPSALFFYFRSRAGNRRPSNRTTPFTDVLGALGRLHRSLLPTKKNRPQ